MILGKFSVVLNNNDGSCYVASGTLLLVVLNILHGLGVVT